MGVKQKVHRLEGGEESASEMRGEGNAFVTEEAAKAKTLRGQQTCVHKEQPDASVAELKELRRR